MKKYLFAMIALAGALALAGCDKENGENKEPLPDPEITNEVEIKDIPFTGGEFTFEFDANRDWTVTGDAEVSVGGVTYEFGLAPTSGEAGHGKITVTAPANKGTEPIEYSFTLTLLGENQTSEDAYTKEFQLTVPAPSVTDANENTYKVAYLGGNYWMTENLRTIPDGMTASETPADKSGFWYPYTLTDVEIYFDKKDKNGNDVYKSKSTAKVAKDDATIKAQGYLYSANIYLGGITYGEDNYTTFEGVQGICPKGWHIPTKADFVALCGFSQSANAAGIAEEKDPTAPFYNEQYKGGKYDNAVECGWNPVLSGVNFNGTAYNTKVITKLNSTKESLFEKQAMTYWAGSTGYSETQVWSMMTTFTLSAYPEGRIHTSFGNVTSGVPVRCVMDKAAE